MQVVHVGLVDLTRRSGLVDGASGLKNLFGFPDGIHIGLLDLPAAQILFQLRQGVFDGLQIGQNQLGVNRLDIIGGVDLAVDVHDVIVLESAHHLADRVGLTDVGQELVA